MKIFHLLVVLFALASRAVGCDLQVKLVPQKAA